MPDTVRYGAIEAGGTKVICGWLNREGRVLKSNKIDTTSPDLVIAKVLEFFQSVSQSESPPVGLGIGTFGPVGLDKKRPNYGCILRTPKKGWQGTNWIKPIRALFPQTKLVIDTDVNAAALGEMRWGAAQGLSNLVYITVGTGIGAGIITNGAPVHGLIHPEVGHIPIPRTDAEHRQFKGSCPFHGACLEGIASGTAIRERWGRNGEDLSSDHPAWKSVTDALAWACTTMILTLSPGRIIIGGGVSQAPKLFPRVRSKVIERLNGYVDAIEIIDHIEEFIVPPKMGQQAGLKGAAALVVPTH